MYVLGFDALSFKVRGGAVQDDITLVSGWIFKSRPDQTTQKPLLLKMSNMVSATRIKVTCENNHIPGITPTTCELFHVKKIERSPYESVIFGVLNTKLVPASMEMVVRSSQVINLWGICNFNNTKNCIKTYYQ